MREGLRSGKKGSPRVSHKGDLGCGIDVYSSEIKVEKVDDEIEQDKGCQDSRDNAGKEVGDGRRGRKRKNVEARKELDLNIGYDDDASVDTCSDVNKVGEARRGRKRKDGRSPSKSDHDIKEEEESSLVSDCIVRSRDSALLTPEKVIKEEKCESEEFLKSVDANGSADGKEQTIKSGRGRKRKNAEGSECSIDDGPVRKKVKDGAVEVSGKVLRSMSRSVEEKVDDDYEEKPKVIGTPKKIQGRRGRPPKVKETDWEWVEDKVDAEKDEKPQRIGRPKQIHGRLGRPPKVCGGDGTLTVETVDTKMDEKPQRFGRRMKSKGRLGRPPKVLGIKRALYVKKADIENEDNPRGTGRPKRFKGCRGRPPKVQGLQGMTVIQKDVSHNPLKSPKVQKKQESSKVNTDKKENAVKVEKITLRDEKQLIREQIIDILLKAGWTIDLRQRQGSEYRDAVYVDRDGKTHWSVTLAYRKLKEKVESGNADSKSVSAFKPIPEEVLSKLFRVTEKGKKCKGGKNNGGKTADKIGKKQASKKEKYATKSIGGSKHNEKKNSAARAVHKSSKKKTKEDTSDSEHDSADNPHNRMSRPNREIRKGRKPCPLLARSSAKGSDADSDSFIPYEGKRSLFSWMIDLGIATSGTKVKYMDSSRTNVLVEGKITADGILCGCCNNIVAISKFLSHTGISVSDDSQPLNDIHLEDGVSFLECLRDSWSKKLELDPVKFCFVDIDGEDPNDDTCNVCADGGNLFCCDGCPSTFHQSCLDIEVRMLHLLVLVPNALIPPPSIFLFSFICKFLEK